MAEKHLKMRPAGNYEIKVTVGKDDSGKVIRQSVYGKSEKEVRAKRDELLAQIRAGLDVNADKKFKTYAEKYLTRYDETHQIGPARDREHANAEMLSIFYERDIASITEQELFDFYRPLVECNPKTGKPTADDTVKKWISTARHIFEEAIEVGALLRNPLDSWQSKPARRPKGREAQDVKPLDEVQRGYVLHTPHEMQMAAMLMIHAGLSPEEAAALTWDDFDFEEHYVLVERVAFSYKNERAVLERLKTNERERKVYLMPVLEEYLLEELHSGKRTGRYIMTNSDKPITKYEFDRKWRSYMTTLDRLYGEHTREIKSNFAFKGQKHTINTFNRYQCRHWLPTLLDELGVDDYTINRQTGHCTPVDDVTHRNYVNRKWRKDKQIMAEIYAKLDDLSYDMSYDRE